ncbi:MAG TPA: SDR family oxidoreductase [Mariprofundaceae bacterium]|nr:SDR family oxidoreductase [Mariprofundaceae bacterium]
MNVVITGANRGIGLGFAQHYLARGDEVWAGYRSDPGGLAGIDDPRLHPVPIDVTGDLDAALPRLPARIDLLINNAGIYGPDTQSLETVAPETMRRVFEVDCIGPLRVVQALKERVIAARGVIANLSSKMGSSADNTSGGCYAYRAAKAALVIVSRSMAIDLASSGVRVITLHPGWVRTDMGGPGGLIGVSDSVNGMAKVLAHVDDYGVGAFVAFDGRPIPY